MGEEKKPSGYFDFWTTRVKLLVNTATCAVFVSYIIQPIDTLKVRIQLGDPSAALVNSTITRHESALYKGFSARLLSQATYTAARLGTFTKPVTLYQKALCGLAPIAIGATVASPTDLALIRMQADATLPVAQRRNYTNVFHALTRISADEGVLALWKGAGPTVVGAMALHMGILASYNQSVEFVGDSFRFFGEYATDISVSSVSGFFAAAFSLPFDYVKTQIQIMQPDATGKYPYTGSLDCAMKTLKAGGPHKFYTGFPVYCLKIAPHVFMTCMLFNRIQKDEG